MASGRQLAEENVRVLRAWAADRKSSEDWVPFIKNGKLNRSAIAGACGFGRSVFAQNPLAKTFLFDLEARLHQDKILQSRSGYTDPPGEKATPNAPPSPADDERLRRLEQEIRKRDERIAVLFAENTELRTRLKCLQHVEQIMETGRRVIT